MRRERRFVLVAALAMAGLVAGVVAQGGGASSKASHARADSKAITRVIVTATDSKFALSKRSAPAGAVIFIVTNKGKISHDFRIGGKKTPLLSPGRSATLRVTLSKEGRYPYLSTVSGQAAAGMKGTFVVIAAPTPPVAPPPTTTTSTTTTSTTVGTANTTVTVDMFDSNLPGRFQLSQTTIPSGMVTFVITNKCAYQCSFDLEGIKAGAILDPGQSETWTVPLAARLYHFHCDESPAMKGAFTVTP